MLLHIHQSILKVKSNNYKESYLSGRNVNKLMSIYQEQEEDKRQYMQRTIYQHFWCLFLLVTVSTQTNHIE